MSSHLRNHPLTDEQRASRWENIQLTGGVVWIMFLTAAAIAGGSWVHAHFAPKEALCNTVGGQLLQQHSTGLLADCGVISLLTQLSELAFWGGIAMAVLIGGMFVWAGVAWMRKPRRA